MPTLGKLLSLVRRQPWGLQRRTEPTPILLEEEIGLVIHRGDTFAGRNGIAKTSVKVQNRGSMPLRGPEGVRYPELKRDAI